VIRVNSQSLIEAGPAALLALGNMSQPDPGVGIFGVILQNLGQ
jgi:hypothetical protein